MHPMRRTMRCWVVCCGIAIMLLFWTNAALSQGCQDDGGELQLDCPAPPNTNATVQPHFDYFAWNTFIALNWPALRPTSDNGYQRGFPNTGKSFVNAASNDLTVWETFKEKREVFNHGGNDPGPWNSQVDYGPLRVAGSDLNRAPKVAARTLHQSSMIYFDSFDETIEVASEALYHSRRVEVG